MKYVFYFQIFFVVALVHYGFVFTRAQRDPFAAPLRGAHGTPKGCPCQYICYAKSGSESCAVIALEKKEVFCKTGDVVDGWKICEIQPSCIELELRDERHKVSIAR